MSEMPMCSECKRPLGLFYAECLTCFGSAHLDTKYYDQWCEWQAEQRIARMTGRDKRLAPVEIVGRAS